jgi:hypothetical protein
MKKRKVTRKPRSLEDFTLRPSRVRMVVIYALFFSLAVLAGMLLRLLFNRQGLSLGELYSDWLVYLAVVVGGAVAFSLMDYSRWTILVLGGKRIEGPSGAMGNRSILDLNQVDWIRTRRSLDSRLKVGNVIYTIERQRILISPWFYSPAAFSEFLDRIGYPGN